LPTKFPSPEPIATPRPTTLPPTIQPTSDDTSGSGPGRPPWAGPHGGSTDPPDPWWDNDPRRRLVPEQSKWKQHSSTTATTKPDRLFRTRLLVQQGSNNVVQI
jgi:hypothetical protein